MPDAVVLPSNEIHQMPDGRRFQGYDIVVSDEVFQQYCEGYRCIMCHAVQDEAFPERCIEGQYGACGIKGGFEMRRLQSEEVARQFQGRKDLWPTRNQADPERERWKQSSAGIIVPVDL